ncbi:helix-turn-helix domain-containing protein [Actinoplanes sp. NEAU-A12]|uniref:Helix-turn-helix domain-containing protein n=1 Tax=Actinoplanes sandaracinus TaxID=3045177 RepID=A0ABT6X0A6_9ACTN|nr:TetR/AcrR family transcriptional regulator [Actinoplanes sandaracinus]MDI6105435.1 helix-turn-helix domain-containing protein [Actinoplanes sandaracinus]
MGNREALLDAARQCLYEKGYARTTLRDITKAAGGVSMAAVGYHFGSKEALMEQALAGASAEWGRALGAALQGLELPADATPVERFEAVWSRVIASFAEYRQLWSATFDVIGQIDHQPQVREHLAAGLHEAREGLARMFAGPGDDLAGEPAREIGNFHQALLTGVMAQHLIDPATAPTARQLAGALARITGG